MPARLTVVLLLAFAGFAQAAPPLDPETAAQLGLPGTITRPTVATPGQPDARPGLRPLSAVVPTVDNGRWLDTPPPRRIQHAAIYDPLRDRMLVFGGRNSEYTPGTLVLPLDTGPVWGFLPLGSGTPPPLGGVYDGVYDEPRDRMIVFGSGGYRVDPGFTWAMNLTGSTHWSPVGSGPLAPRQGAAVALDTRRNRLLVFGGRDSVNLDEVWTLDLAGGSAWTRLHPQGTPPIGKFRARAVYDPEGDRLVVFGGAVETEPHYLENTNETWILDLAGTPTWSRLDSTANAPPAASIDPAVYDPVNERMLLVGQSVWSLSLVGPMQWTVLPVVGRTPLARYGQTAVYDRRRERVLVYGGTLTPRDPVDVDVLDLRNQPAWERLSSVERPRPRFGHATVHDLKRDRVLVFGGVASDGFLGDGDYTNEAWEISLADPTDIHRVQPSGTPPAPRHEPVGVYDPVGDRAVFFGGWTYPSNYFNDTWTLSLAAGPVWQHVLPQGTPPPARRADAAVYDPARHRMLVFGGGDDAGPRNDLWALHLDEPLRWEQLEPVGAPPPARYFPSFTYDPVRDRVVLYGGSLEGRTTNDIWSLELSDLRWAPLVPNGELPPLARHMTAYDPLHDQLLVHGGWDLDYDLLFMGPWTYAISLDAHPRLRVLWPPPPWPDARAAHSLVFDPSRERMVIWGGTDFGFSYNDAWTLQFDEPGRRPAWLLATRATPDAVRLDWYVADGAGNEVTLERRFGESGWIALGSATVDAGRQVHFEDRGVETGGEYRYRVSVVGHASDEATIVVPGGSGIVLLGARPNPSASGVPEIAFWLPGGGEARLEVYDVRGRRVWSSPIGGLGQGVHRVQPEGVDAPGVYFARLIRGAEEQSTRFVTLR